MLRLVINFRFWLIPVFSSIVNLCYQTSKMVKIMMISVSLLVSLAAGCFSLAILIIDGHFMIGKLRFFENHF